MNKTNAIKQARMEICTRYYNDSYHVNTAYVEDDFIREGSPRHYFSARFWLSQTRIDRALQLLTGNCDAHRDYQGGSWIGYVY